MVLQTHERHLARARVLYTEYERGWGSKVFLVEYFADINEAQDEANKVNSKNTAKSAPDYYITAEVEILK